LNPERVAELSQSTTPRRFSFLDNILFFTYLTLLFSNSFERANTFSNSLEWANNATVMRTVDQSMERVFKALANKRRLLILQYLKYEGRKSVTEIARHIKLSIKATSKHLGIMANAGIVEKEQVSVLMFYWLSDNLPRVAKPNIDLL
jgi:DNA-binding transcriptional ArsR family regulator